MNNGAIRGFRAGAAIEPYTIVKFGTSHVEVVPSTSPDDLHVGVTCDIGAAKGERIDVRMGEIGDVRFGGPIRRGQRITANGFGRAIAAGSGVVAGVALVSGEDGDIGAALVVPGLGLTGAMEAQPFAVRAGAYGGSTGTNKTDGTKAGATYRQFVPIAGAVTGGIVAGFANWWISAAGAVGGVVNGDNPITVKAGIEYNGTTYPVTFNGQRTVIIQPGVTLYHDPLDLILPAGAIGLWYRTYVTANGVANGTWPLGRLTDQAAGVRDFNNYTGAATDIVDATGSFAGAGQQMYGPVAVLGRLATPNKSIAFLGDSIPAGSGAVLTGGYALATGFIGPIERALGTKYGWVSATRSGYKSAFVVAGDPSMTLFAKVRPTINLSQLGVNDCTTAGATLASVQAIKIAEWNLLLANGGKVMQTTITPTNTSSTDGWTSVAGQTILNAGADAIRVAFNDWLRGGAPISGGAAVAVGTAGALTIGQAGHPLAGYIEAADAVESARNSGKFAVAANARAVNDAAMTAGSNILTSASAAFTAADVGYSVYVPGAAAGGAAYMRTIVSVTNGTTAVMSANAQTTVNGVNARFGALTFDGLHPNDGGAVLMAAPIAAALA